MTAKGSCCCCSLCGIQLPPESSVCCLCICDTLCVEIDGGGGACDCDVAFFLIPWDTTQCAYVGTAVCGSLSIDLRFDIRKCADDNCYLCLTSTCLALDGQCPTAGSGCMEFSSHDEIGGCGDYKRDCTQDGGWNETWGVDATDCLPPGSGQTCTSVSIHVTCYDRVNPAGSGTTRLCKDCDCVCDCVIFGYEEAAGGLHLTKLPVCWDGSWSSTLRLCAGDPQVVTVEIVRDDDTGCCYWKVTISKGVFATGYPGVGTTIALIKTECPDIDIELGIDLPAADTAILTIVCAGCPQVPCCPCEWLEDYVKFSEYCGCSSPSRGRLKVTIEGSGFSGYVILTGQTGAGGDFPCLFWDIASGACNDDTNLVNTCGFIISALKLECWGDGTFHFTFAGTTSGCSFENPAQSDVDCGPPLLAHYTTTPVSVPPETCPSECTQTITITVETMDPWP